MAKSISPLIELQGVTKHYHTKAGAFPALKDIHLNVFPGEFLGEVDNLAIGAQPDLTRSELIHPGNHVQQGGFAGARFSNHTHAQST